MQAIVERLRAERGRSTTYEDVREYARKRAAAWAKRAHYDQLRYYGELEVGADPDHYYATEFRFPEDGEEDAAEDYRDDREEKRLSFDWGTYCRAWHEQVQAFWQRIKDQL
jgi:hypothetical protein